MTKVVNKRLDSYTHYIGRGSIFGNQFVIGIHGDRTEVIAKYKDWFYAKLKLDPKFKEEVLKLKGGTLGCFCKQRHVEVACHGDVIKEFLDSHELLESEELSR